MLAGLSVLTVGCVMGGFLCSTFGVYCVCMRGFLCIFVGAFFWPL